MAVPLAAVAVMSFSCSWRASSAAAAGAVRIAIAPLFWAEGGHLKREVPELIAQAQARHPHLRIERWPVLGASPEVLAALSGVYRERWQAAGV